MALTCDASDLAEAAKKFTCLSPDMREAVKTYLLAVMAGGSTDPAVLMPLAACFKCVPDQKALQNYLLCQILNL